MIRKIKDIRIHDIFEIKTDKTNGSYRVAKMYDGGMVLLKLVDKKLKNLTRKVILTTYNKIKDFKKVSKYNIRKFDI
ncbi:hypothetical protein M0R19_08180 [Candidatus Pacearchaeota archaeon]|jgi:hypothetical protein|nr:hypothetical protein [bacterium]MCK9597135.1 hypothetical protein [Candidatus Pacearchaeota archaeon]